MYEFMKQEMSSQYDMIITEVDITNTRSVGVHFTIGFKQLKTYYSSPHQWALLAWNWN